MKAFSQLGDSQIILIRDNHVVRLVHLAYSIHLVQCIHFSSWFLFSRWYSCDSQINDNHVVKVVLGIHLVRII